MIIRIQKLLTKSAVDQLRIHLDQAQWEDGRATAGTQAKDQKRNQQIPQQSEMTQQIGDLILTALSHHPTFIAAALPLKIYPPMLNRYEQGETYGLHVDNAIRIVPGTPVRVRTDLSATLFLSEPDEYQGGELQIEDNYGTHNVKLAAGDMILYPSTSLHQVTPVTQGCRTSAFLWLQSMVRSHEQREILFDLDQSIQSLTPIHGHEHPDVMRLTTSYHRLIRQWCDT